MYVLECTEAAEMCKNLQPFLNIIKILLEILRWTVPILLIVFGSIDMFNAVTKADDEKILQDARQKLIKRIIYGIVVFLVPLIVNLVMDLVEEAGIKDENSITATTWVSCWNDSIDTSGCSDIYAPKEETSVNTNEHNYSNNTDSNNNNKVQCKNSCLRKNLILGRETEGNLNNNACTYSAVLDVDANLDCTQSCKNTWGNSGYISSNSNSSGGCSCKYSTNCN